VKRIHALVEGQTQETFVRDILGPHFLPLGLFIGPIIVATKKVKSGGKFRGGVNSYQQVRRDLQNLLGDRGAVAVTTMLDLYGLPDDFPGKDRLPRGGSCYERVSFLEEALSTDVDHVRFIPYLSLHEFEALLLVSPMDISHALPGQPSMDRLVEDLSGFDSPEEVNEGPETHPAARIQQLAKGYQKRLHGPLITGRIGLAAIRERCPHFAGWLRRLEDLE